jgi:hypothetical protein
LDSLLNWLNNLNLIEVALTSLLSSYATLKASGRDFEKGVRVTNQAKQEIISELRGQIDSIRKEK